MRVHLPNQLRAMLVEPEPVKPRGAPYHLPARSGALSPRRRSGAQQLLQALGPTDRFDIAQNHLAMESNSGRVRK